MHYDVDFLGVEREIAEGQFHASVIYRFAISNGLSNTHADVLMTDGAVDVIERKGKDPGAAARIALERLLRNGRDPFQRVILLKIPFGHAAHFATYGNYETLPILTG